MLQWPVISTDSTKAVLGKSDSNRNYENPKTSVDEYLKLLLLLARSLDNDEISHNGVGHFEPNITMQGTQSLSKLSYLLCIHKNSRQTSFSLSI